MLSKGSGKDSKSTQDAAAAAVAASSNPQKPSTSGQQPGTATFLPNSPPGGRTAGAGPSMSGRAMNLHPKQIPSFKGTSQSPTAAMLSPIASQNLSQGSPDLSLRSSKSSLVLSPAGSDAAQIRSVKPSLDLAYISDAAQLRSLKPSLDLMSASSGQSRSFKPSLDVTSVQGMPLTTAASLPTSGLKGNFQPSSKAAALSRLESHREAGAHSPPPTLTSQPSQPVQTVQQMLAEMQQGRKARESLGNGGKVPLKTMTGGTSAMTDAIPIPEGVARQAVPGVALRDSRITNSPFADHLAGKPHANAISRRCAMGGPSTHLSLLHFLQSPALHIPPATHPCSLLLTIFTSARLCFCRSPGSLAIVHKTTHRLSHMLVRTFTVHALTFLSTLLPHLLSLSFFACRHGHWWKQQQLHRLCGCSEGTPRCLEGCHLPPSPPQPPHSLRIHGALWQWWAGARSWSHAAVATWRYWWAASHEAKPELGPSGKHGARGQRAISLQQARFSNGRPCHPLL